MCRACTGRGVAHQTGSIVFGFAFYAQSPTTKTDPRDGGKVGFACSKRKTDSVLDVRLTRGKSVPRKPYIFPRIVSLINKLR